MDTARLRGATPHDRGPTIDEPSEDDQDDRQTELQIRPSRQAPLLSVECHQESCQKMVGHRKSVVAGEV